MFNGFLQQTYFQNKIIDYLTVLAIFILLIIVIKIGQGLLIKLLKAWAKKTTTKIDNKFVIAFEQKIKPFLNLLYFSVLYFSIKQLNFNPQIEKFLNVFFIVLLTFFGVRFLLSIITYSVETYWIKKEKDLSKKQVLKGVITILNLVAWSIAIIILLDNLGIKVSALVAGLGIGGIAIALAAQTLLGDFFSYFIIFFDRPFKIGDFIIVGDYLGTVDHIGLKTTRIHSLSGEQIVFSNQDLTNSRVRNYKQMDRRRVAFQFGVIYQTPLEQLKKIPRIVEDIITNIPETSFDRAHFASYGDFSLNFEVVYYVQGSNYNKYMNVQQEINFQLKEAFEKQEIEFAYPTQTVLLTNEN
ncbi:MAG: mechanosensitive ion channel family protein [bacterium]|nr:mechanosensitive ion channel family protein [bacterium]MDO9555026.1 mechanosensitive ion channel family protein [Atribacterota bacterium]